jgi:hypothetical protein
MSLFKKLFSRRKKEAPEPPPEFLQATPPDWLIEAKGQAGTDGDKFSIRLQLMDKSRTGNADVVQWPAEENQQPRTAQIELLRAEIDRLFVILGFSFPVDIHDINPGDHTGTPASITVHRREHYALKSGECDLAAWLHSKKSGPPIVEIGRVLMAVRERALADQK